MSKTLKYILHGAIFVGLGIAAFKYLRGEDVLAALASFNYAYAPYLLALSAFYLALMSWRFAFMVRSLAEVPWSLAMRVYAAGQAATLVPGGVAARAGLLKQVDVPVAKSAVPVAFSSIFNQSVLIAASLAAAIWFEEARTPALILLGALAVLAVVLLVPASRSGLVRLGAKIAGRFDAEEKWETFLDALEEFFSWRLLAVAFAVTVVAVASKVLTLDLALRGAGQSLPYATLVLAYVLPTMLGRLSGLPAGGIGVTEAGMIGFLTAAGKLDTGTATAAVAIYRIATVFFQALLGALVYAFAWRGDDETAVEGA